MPTTTTTTTTTTQTIDDGARHYTITLYHPAADQRGHDGLASPTYARTPRARLECRWSHSPDDADPWRVHIGGILYTDAGRPAMLIGRDPDGINVSVASGTAAVRCDSKDTRKAFAAARNAWRFLTAECRAAVADIPAGHLDDDARRRHLVGMVAAGTVAHAVAAAVDPARAEWLRREMERLTADTAAADDTPAAVPAYPYGSAYCPACDTIDETAGIEPDGRADCPDCGAESIGLEDAVIAGHIAARYA